MRFESTQKALTIEKASGGTIKFSKGEYETTDDYEIGVLSHLARNDGPVSIAKKRPAAKPDTKKSESKKG